MIRSPIVVLVLLVSPALAGCVAGVVAAGAAAGTYGAYKFSRNEVHRDYAASLEATWAASQQALAELGYPAPSTANLGTTEGELRAGDAYIRLERYPNQVTRARVRIGRFESQEHRRRAQLLLEAITARLL